MEQIPNIVLILIMVLMSLMLAHGIITRKKKEELEKEYLNSEHKLEELMAQEHLNAAEYLQKTYEEKITQMQEQHRRTLLEYEEKIDILKSKYKRDISNLTTERDYFAEKIQEIKLEASEYKPQIKFLHTDATLAFMFEALNQSEEDFILASQDIAPPGVSKLLAAFRENFNRNLAYKILIGLENFPRDDLDAFISLVILSHQRDNLIIRGTSYVPYNLLTSDDKWAIYGSYVWLRGEANSDYAYSLQVFEEQILKSLKQPINKLFQEGADLEVAEGTIATLKKRIDKFFLTMDNFEGEIFVESQKLRTTLNNLKSVRDNKTQIKMLIKKSDNSFYYLGHINRA